MRSHSVACHPAEVTFPPLSQPKLVLDFATPEGCKAELTWGWLYPKIVYPRNTVTYLRNNQAVSWPGFDDTRKHTHTYTPIHTATQTARQLWTSYTISSASRAETRAANMNSCTIVYGL